ncbi:tryptophan synthase subunit alpha [Pimelobacter simplex]|uniref:tryptophan synthase subunit alpha n=1 Tax=Nocardioides simplex TaxID=2045 RepID=UPI00214F7416|nr:tryptophan synthase subunit alpha [Pimelobacter simplex]UUW92539.1 tryptophan synthase subunit alpha [Pimelobacter simplex]UUW96367.1 tryptophan synthase subunit alpha [Pimelobacter simplex]
MSTSDAFASASRDDRAALIGYLPAGFPSVEGSITALRVMAESGCDVIEVGLPYSDPVMDGSAVEAAARLALQRGFRTRDVFHVVEEVSKSGVDVVVMSYWNLIERYGSGRFARDLSAAGGAGVVTPDLPFENASAWVTETDQRSLDHIFLVAPSSADHRLKATALHCSGFVYATAVMGVTGVRAGKSDLAEPLVKRARAVTNLPIAVGIGVSNGEQAAEIATFADGVIVGSAFVRAIETGRGNPAVSIADLRTVSQLAAGLATAARRPARGARRQAPIKGKAQCVADGPTERTQRPSEDH